MEQVVCYQTLASIDYDGVSGCRVAPCVRDGTVEERLWLGVPVNVKVSVVVGCGPPDASLQADLSRGALLGADTDIAYVAGLEFGTGGSSSGWSAGSRLGFIARWEAM